MSSTTKNHLLSGIGLRERVPSKAELRDLGWRPKSILVPALAIIGFCLSLAAVLEFVL